MAESALPGGHSHPLYCRFDNRMVSCCPRLGAMLSCPLRADCPASRALVQPAVAPPGVSPLG